MKLCLATLALAQAAKNGKGGKHGNRNIQNDRYVWQTPSCLSNPDLCTKEETFTKSAGKIVLNQDNYNNFEVNISTRNRPQLTKNFRTQFTTSKSQKEKPSICSSIKMLASVLSGTTCADMTSFIFSVATGTTSRKPTALLGFVDQRAIVANLLMAQVTYLIRQRVYRDRQL